MSQIVFKKITDLLEAEKAWRELSPHQVIFDDWDFRYGYYKYFQYPLYFYAAYEGEKLVGLLPLMWDEQKKSLDFFASFGYMENNGIFLKPGYESLFPEFLKQIEKPALLEYMRPPQSPTPFAKVHDYNYSIDLRGMKGYRDFMNIYLNGDKRNNLTSQFHTLENLNVQVQEGTIADLNTLFYWNKVRFGAHSSFYTRPHFEEYIRYIASRYESQVICITINGKVEGVGLILFYNNICHGINSGYNPDISNLGKYITMIKIDAGIKAGKEIYDAGTGAFGWKEDFHLQKSPQYQIDLRHGNLYERFNLQNNF